MLAWIVLQSPSNFAAVPWRICPDFRLQRVEKQAISSFLAQQGIDPEDWKAFSLVGPGVREIRIRDREGAFRVMYVASFANAVYVLHCFQKKTQKTREEDIELAKRRYKILVRELKQ